MEKSERYKTATEIAYECQIAQGGKRIDLWLEYLKYVHTHLGECIELIEEMKAMTTNSTEPKQI